MNTLSFMTANYVARPAGYHISEWMEGQAATEDYFRPAETYTERLEDYLHDIAAMGFAAVDIWMPILPFTPTHITAAKALLQKYQLEVVSLAGGFGDTLEEFEQSCQLAAELNTTVLGGSTPLLQTDREAVVKLLQSYKLRLAIENHPEKSPGELRMKAGDGGTIGVVVDTGWFGTHGYNAAMALCELADILLHVHLKDILAEDAHESCCFGEGIVPVQACIKTLKQLGYTGAISIEHEPYTYDPTGDCIASLAMVQGWLAQGPYPLLQNCDDTAQIDYNHH